MDETARRSPELAVVLKRFRSRVDGSSKFHCAMRLVLSLLALLALLASPASAFAAKNA